MRKLELKLKTCEECPYFRYDPFYSMQTDSGYDCWNNDAPHMRIINDSQIGKIKWNYEIPDWCPLEIIDET